MFVREILSTLDLRDLERGPFPELLARVAVAMWMGKKQPKEVSVQSRLVDSGISVFEHVSYHPKQGYVAHKGRIS